MNKVLLGFLILFACPVLGQTTRTALTCDNWLRTQAVGQSVKVGDIDVTGTQMTIEANFNCSSFPVTRPDKWEDIVSKHSNTTDANYVLRMDLAAITTTTGHYLLSPGCDNLALNKTFHVALTYDGVTLKFYRNGFLMGQMPVTGNLITNNLITTIGDYAVNNPVGTNFLGYINEVRIWNVARTQTQLQSYMSSSLPNPTTQTGLLGYYTFETLLNKQGNPAYNGVLTGGASINNANPNCNFVADSCAIAACPSKNDFSFKRNPCSPYEVEFSTNTTGFSSIKWDFGDGNTASAVTTTTNTYAGTGNYLVSMITNFGACSDTTKKIITVDLQNDNQLIVTPDTTICLGSTKKLRTLSGLNFCWSPTTFLDNPLLSEPTTSTPGNMTYYYTAEITGANIIVNGNFNAGNTGFTSDYNYANPNTIEAQYFVGTSPQAWNPLLSTCTDHTTGNGNMLLVNGSSTPGAKVWTETVSVTPNTNYAFSTWIQSLYNQNPAQLSFSINGKDIGGLIAASVPTCTWKQFYTTWNSGNNTTATISIINKNTTILGNDFALDDISFSGVFMKRDSVIITVDTPAIVTSLNSTICEGKSVQLNTTGAVTYTWSPITGLSDPTIANPVASPIITTEYHVSGINIHGCLAKDTVTIDVSPKPSVTIHNDTSICRNTSVQLYATGGVTYQWTPIGTLDDATSPNPIASPSDSTMYHVTVTNANNCTNEDSVIVKIVSASQFAINDNIQTCFKQPVQLFASGGDVYTWSPAGTLDDPSIPNPMASPTGTTTYSVTITENKCNVSATLFTTITSLPLPNVKANKTNDIDCSQNKSQLIASGANGFIWSPAGTLNNPNSGGPIATPTITTKYYVTGTDRNSCSNKDSVTVIVNYADKSGYLMPTGFTPNNDGKNDCYGIKFWGQIMEVEFSIYNRWGERVFYTTDPTGCWNGRYKGAEQDPGVFVYMIRAKTVCDPAVFRKGTFVLIR